nr:hypothetical protein [Clostridia bacterium]
MKRLISLLLLTSMLISAAACSSQSDNNTDDTTAASGDTADTVTTAAEPTDEELLAAAKASVTEKDYDGYEFKIGTRSESVAWATIDVFAEEQDGDPINDAVYERNTFISERLNITIKSLSPGYSVADDVKTSVLAAEHKYDAVTDGLYQLADRLAITGSLIDFNEIPGIDLSADCWDSELTTGLSVNDRVYFATGDISIMDNYGTWCLLFNKDIMKDYNLDDPYGMVRNGSWVFDEMYGMVKKVARDLDGDGVMGDWDQYGMLTEDFNTFGFWSASGEKIITKDKDDLPVLSLYNERSESVFRKVIEMQLDTTNVMGSDRHKKTNVPSGIDPVDMMFKGGYSLFIFGGLWLVSDYRDSEVDFGILPAPKFDENQDSYHSTYSYSNCTAYSIPITATELELTCDVMQAMALISKYTLTPAYYDVALEGKFLRDEESKDMIDLVLATRNYDLGSIFNWGGSYSIFSELYRAKSTDFSSKYSANESKITTAIEEFKKLDFLH